MGPGITDQSDIRGQLSKSYDAALAETVVIMMRLAAIREIHLNGEVNKPSLAEVLEYQGLRMECSAESTPHEETCIYSSAYDGGRLLTEFEETGKEITEDGGIDEIPTRSQGERRDLHCATTGNLGSPYWLMSLLSLCVFFLCVVGVINDSALASPCEPLMAILEVPTGCVRSPLGQSK